MGCKNKRQEECARKRRHNRFVATFLIAKAPFLARLGRVSPKTRVYPHGAHAPSNNTSYRRSHIKQLRCDNLTPVAARFAQFPGIFIASDPCKKISSKDDNRVFGGRASMGGNGGFWRIASVPAAGQPVRFLESSPPSLPPPSRRRTQRRRRHNGARSPASCAPNGQNSLR